jgi:hypothetical protein
MEKPKQPTIEESLYIIKQVLDRGVENKIFQTIDQVNTVIVAYNVLATNLLPAIEKEKREQHGREESGRDDNSIHP